MTACVAPGAFSIHPGSVHSAVDRSTTKAPSSIHSKVARPRPTERPSTIGSNSHEPMRRPSGEAGIASTASRGALGDGVLGEDGVGLSDGLDQALLLAHR